MITSEDVGALEHEQRGIERAGRLHWFHWTVVLLSLAVTLFAWRTSSRALEERTAQRFEREANQAVELFEERLQSYADLVQASAGLITASERVTRAEWRRYTDTLDLAGRFPAITGLGVVREVPERRLDDFVAVQRETYPDFTLRPPYAGEVHLPMTLIAPERLEPMAIGRDLAHEPRRREAVRRAVRLGRTQITAPVRPTRRDALGFVVIAPVFGDDASTSEGGRQARFTGAVVASVVVEDLAAGVLDKGKRQVAIRISDGDEVIHDEHVDHDPRGARIRPLSLSRSITLHGRRWHFDIRSTPAFHDEASSVEPALILGGGLTIDALLLILFALLSRANRRALDFATRAGERLRDESRTLEQTNEELATFAYVVSHDLKAPLNGVGYLAEFIEEDLPDYPDSERARVDVHRNITRLKRHVRRGHALIGGILDYSGLGTQPELATTVDVRELLEAIGESLGLDHERLVLPASLPVLDTYATRLEQVLSNLVGNAIKYHHDAPHARIEIGVEREEDRYRFSVGDDGPGIDPLFHARIFELFGTLESSDEVDSTGVGLSIVKKTVELMGGDIAVESAPGRGTTFAFDWPVHVAAVDGDSDEREPAGTDASRDADRNGESLRKAA